MLLSSVLRFRHLLHEIEKIYLFLVKYHWLPVKFLRRLQRKSIFTDREISLAISDNFTGSQWYFTRNQWKDISHFLLKLGENIHVEFSVEFHVEVSVEIHVNWSNQMKIRNLPRRNLNDFFNCKYLVNPNK